MNHETAITILTKHINWRRGEQPYEFGGANFEFDPKEDNCVKIPHTPKELGEAIDYAVEALRQTQWQPIESAPKNGKEIIVTDGHDVFTARYRISNCSNDAPYFAVSADGELFNRGTDWQFEPDYRSPTHWMPLPQPPDAK